jgi:ABC-type amino acid transport substrate-binding protein
MDDLSRATGFSVADIGGYFGNAGVEPPPAPVYTPPPAPVSEPVVDYYAQQFEPDRFEPVYTPPPVVSEPAGIASLPAATPSAVDKLTQQILAQGTTDQWKGEGKGSAQKNAEDMAKILADTGITDISQFGKVTKTVDAAVIPQTQSTVVGYDNEGNQIVDTKILGYTDQNGKSIDPSLVRTETVYTGGDSGNTETVYIAPVGKQEAFGNKTTGQAVADTYGERQIGNAFGGTYSGEGNTGYRVQFDDKGNPIFYTTQASSSNIADLAPILAIASFIPALAPFAQALNAAIAIDRGDILGGIASLAGVAGMSQVSTGLKVVNALEKGEIDLALMWGPVAGFENKTQHQSRWQVLPISGESLGGQVAIAVSKEKPQLKDQINKALEELKPEIQQLTLKYGFPTQAPLLLNSAKSKTTYLANAPAAKAGKPGFTKVANKPAPTEWVVADATAPYDLAEVRSNFNNKCSHCHAPNGASPVQERDLRKLKVRYGDDWKKVTYDTITKGRIEYGMPVWGGILPEHEIQDILRFLDEQVVKK